MSVACSHTKCTRTLNISTAIPTPIIIHASTRTHPSIYIFAYACIPINPYPSACFVQMDMLYIYDTRTRKCLSRTLFDEQINEYVWDGSGEHLLLTTGSGNIDISKYTAMTEPVHRIPSHLEVIGITFDRHYNYLATTATDGMIQIYDAQELASVNQITRSESMVRDMGFSHDGQFIAFASEEKKVDVCDVLTGDLVFSYPLGREIYSVAWHPHKMVLAFGGETEATVTQQPQRQYNSYHNRNYHSRQNHTVTTIAAPITLVGEFKQ